MSYYEKVSKHVRKDNAMLAMRMATATHPTCNKFADLPAVFTVQSMGDLYRLIVSRWTGSGKCVRTPCYTIPFGHDQIQRIEYGNGSFFFDLHTMSVHRSISSIQLTDTPDEAAIAQAIVPFIGGDVVLPEVVQKGDMALHAKRYYNKRKMVALSRYMPEHYNHLPLGWNGSPAAYYITPQSVKVVRPTTAALSLELEVGDSNALRGTEHPIYGTVKIGNNHYTIDGKVLTVAGKTADPAQYRRVGIDHIKPAWAHQIPGEQAWLEPDYSSGRSRVNICWPSGEGIQKDNKVLYSGGEFLWRKKRFKINVDGSIAPAQKVVL